MLDSQSQTVIRNSVSSDCISDDDSNQQEANLASPVSNFSEDSNKSADIINGKPNHSYISLIANAILASPEKRLVLSDIYKHVLECYSYFKSKGSGWRNSIRHNLSLNDCFIKAGRSPNGKGHFWAINTANFDDFSRGDFRRRRAQKRARRTSVVNDYSMYPGFYHPYHHVNQQHNKEELYHQLLSPDYFYRYRDVGHSKQTPRDIPNSYFNYKNNNKIPTIRYTERSSPLPPTVPTTRPFDIENLLKKDSSTIKDMNQSKTANYILNYNHAVNALNRPAEQNSISNFRFNF